MLRYFALLAALVPLASSIHSTHASLLELEPFNYPGNLGSGLDTLNGGLGWGGPWTDTDALPTLSATETSLNYPAGVPLAPTGGRIETTADAVNNPVFRLLGTTMDLSLSSQTFYSSALFRRSALTGELTSVLFDRTSDNAIRWYYGIDTNGFFSTAVNPSDLTQRATSTFPAEPDTTYLLVSKIRTNTAPNGNDEVFLRVYAQGAPVIEPQSDAEWDLAAAGTSGVVLNRMRISMSNVGGQSNAFDELRVGTTFADVTGIPEPGALSLFAAASIPLFTRRRPKSRVT
jgi:hypothetical protein